MESSLTFLNKNLKILFLFFTLVFTVSLFFFVGISTWLFIYIFFCFFLFAFLFFFRGGIQLTMFVTLLVFLFPIVSGTVLLVTLPKEKKATSKMSVEECKEMYGEYNGKVLNIKGEKLIGTAEIEMEKDTCKTTVSYTFQFSASLSKNDNLEFGNMYWGYFAEYDPGDDRSTWSGRGEIFPVYKNAGKLPEPDVEPHEFYGGNTTDHKGTTEFYHWYSSIYTFSEDSYNDLFTKTRYVILDGRNYIKTDEAGGTELDIRSAAPVAPIAKEFKLEISER
jgi:hypothetical protein